jgi:hypothetical protein
VTRLCEALGWTAENRPSRGADAVFQAASDEIVVTWLDGQLEPRRRRGGLVAAAVVVALLAAGVAVGIFSRTAAPTVTTGDDTPTTTVAAAPVPSGCRLVGDCLLPTSPRLLEVDELPDGFERVDATGPSVDGQPGAFLAVPARYPQGGSGLPAGITLQVIRRAGVTLNADPLRPPPFTTTIGHRGATMFPAVELDVGGIVSHGSDAMTNSLWVDLNDDLLLWAQGSGVSDGELRDVVESVTIR